MRLIQERNHSDCVNANIQQQFHTAWMSLFFRVSTIPRCWKKILHRTNMDVFRTKLWHCNYPGCLTQQRHHGGADQPPHATNEDVRAFWEGSWATWSRSVHDRLLHSSTIHWTRGWSTSLESSWAFGEDMNKLDSSAFAAFVFVERLNLKKWPVNLPTAIESYEPWRFMFGFRGLSGIDVSAHRVTFEVHPGSATSLGRPWRLRDSFPPAGVVASGKNWAGNGYGGQWSWTWCLSDQG